MTKSCKEAPKKEARQHYVKFPISLHHLHLITTLFVPFALCHSSMNVHNVFEFKNQLCEFTYLHCHVCLPLMKVVSFWYVWVPSAGHVLVLQKHDASHDAEAVHVWVYISVSGEAAFDLEHIFPQSPRINGKDCKKVLRKLQQSHFFTVVITSQAASDPNNVNHYPRLSFSFYFNLSF